MPAAQKYCSNIHISVFGCALCVSSFSFKVTCNLVENRLHCDYNSLFTLFFKLQLEYIHYNRWNCILIYTNIHTFPLSAPIAICTPIQTPELEREKGAHSIERVWLKILNGMNAFNWHIWINASRSTWLCEWVASFHQPFFHCYTCDPPYKINKYPCCAPTIQNPQFSVVKSFAAAAAFRCERRTHIFHVKDPWQIN